MRPNEKDFVDSFDELSSEAYRTAKEKGFWEGDNDNVPSKLCLMHSEISEALEAYRLGNPPSEKIDGFSSIEEELADEIIRVMDFSKRHSLRTAEAVISKLWYNKDERSYKHGGKKC